MASHPAARGEDCACCTHALDIFGVSLLAHKYYGLAAFFPGNCISGTEDNLAVGPARAGRQAFYQGLLRLFRCRINNRVEQLIELRRGNAHYCFFSRNHLFLKHLTGHAHGSRAIALSHARLEHKQAAGFNGEFNILHIAIMPLEAAADFG